MDELFERILGKLRKTGFLTDDLTVQKDGNQQVIPPGTWHLHMCSNKSIPLLRSTL